LICMQDMEDIGAKLQVLAVNLERLGGEKVEDVQEFHDQWQDFVRAVHMAATVGQIESTAATTAEPSQGREDQRHQSHRVPAQAQQQAATTSSSSTAQSEASKKTQASSSSSSSSSRAKQKQQEAGDGRGGDDDTNHDDDDDRDDDADAE